ncbi:MAG: IS256 family transposase [Kiritimatiellia bacterium]|jgi:transposase-like protein|nr:IS256 family transposase [Kiritimatiellia bacterium]
MSDDKVVSLQDRVAEDSRTALDEIARLGAQEMLKRALENEVSEYVQRHAGKVDEDGKRVVVRNGKMPRREIVSGVGPLEVEQPRVHDRRSEQRFTSQILPPFLRRLPSVDNLIPVLYLKGVSTGDFSEALKAILGENASGLSATNIVRLKQEWEKDYEGWQGRSLQGKRYVYLWADGIYFNVRLADDRPCLLVTMGTLEDGRKELVAIHDGERESKLSWLETLRDLRRRGLEHAPKLAIGDGALGFWAALAEAFPETQWQRCWIHKKANVLNKMPKKVQPSAKKLLDEMHQAETEQDAMDAYDEFQKLYQAKFPKACECLSKDKDVLFTFYSFPAEHWNHIRTTNPIESTFATVRHRTRRTKGCGSRTATLTMVFKLCLEAQKTWRRINGYDIITLLIQGRKFVDGVMEDAA